MYAFGNVGASGGDSLLVIGALFGHRDAKTTQRYAHLQDDPIRAASDRISGTIAAAMARTSGRGSGRKTRAEHQKAVHPPGQRGQSSYQ